MVQQSQPPLHHRKLMGLRKKREHSKDCTWVRSKVPRFDLTCKQIPLPCTSIHLCIDLWTVNMTASVDIPDKGSQQRFVEGNTMSSTQSSCTSEAKPAWQRLRFCRKTSFGMCFVHLSFVVHSFKPLSVDTFVEAKYTFHNLNKALTTIEPTTLCVFGKEVGVGRFFC